MKEKFNNITNEAKELINFSHPSRKVILGSVAALAVFATFPNETEALPAPDPVIKVNYLFNFRNSVFQSVQSNGAYRTAYSGLNIKNTGLTECDLDVKDVDGKLQEGFLKLRVDKPENHRWVRDTRFKEKQTPIVLNPEKTQASAKVSAGYNNRALADQNQRNRLRIVCESDYTKNRQYFNKKDLGIVAQIIINKTVAK